METTLLHQRKEEKYYSSNQEEGPKLLRLGSPIPTPTTLTDQESPIMFSDSCSMCGSKNSVDEKAIGDQKAIGDLIGDQKDRSRAVKKCSMEMCDSCSMCGSKKPKRLKSSLGERKNTILVDPSSMKEAASSSTDDEISPIRHSSSFLHQIPPNSSSPPQAQTDISSFALSGSFSSPKSPSAAAVIPNQTSCPSNAAYLGRSSSFPSSFDSLKTSPFSSPKSPENTAVTPNQKSNPSNSPSYFGRSNSFSSCFDSPSSSSSPCFHLPKSSTPTPTPTSTDSVQTKDDQKPIGDQKDCSRGNCKVDGVLAATTTSTDHHPKHEQIEEEGNIKKVQFSCSCGKQTSSPNSPSSSSPCFHLPNKSSTTATPPTDSVQKSDDQKPIGDQTSIGDQKDCSRGNCRVGVLAATTTTTSTGHPNHQQIVHPNLNSIDRLGCDLLNYLISYFKDRAQIPMLCSKTLLATLAINPIHIDKRVIRSGDPLTLEIDWDRLERRFTSSWLSYKERNERLTWFIESLLREHKRVQKLYLAGPGGMICKSVTSHQLKYLKFIQCYNVRISSVKAMVGISGCVEEIQLKKCNLPSYFKLKLGPESKLKALLMDMCVGLTNEKISQIIIKIPTLLTFRFRGWLCLFDFSGTEQLSEGDIKFMDTKPLLTKPTSRNEVFELLKSLQNVQSLSICNVCLKNLSGNSSSSSATILFPNLKELTLSTVSLEENHEVKDLAILVNSAPMLSHLSIHADQWFIGAGLWRTNPIGLDHLKYFRIEPFRCGDSEMELISEVLMKAKLLKKAEILLLYGVKCSSMNNRAQQKLMKAFEDSKKVSKSILALPKASAEAEVVVILEEGFRV